MTTYPKRAFASLAGADHIIARDRRRRTRARHDFHHNDHRCGQSGYAIVRSGKGDGVETHFTCGGIELAENGGRDAGCIARLGIRTKSGRGGN